MPPAIRLKDHQRDKRLLHQRLIITAAFVLLLTGVLVARMYYLQVVQYEHHSTLAENNRIHVQPLPPTRGLIYDRNGVLLADNRPSFSLTLTRERAGDWKQVLETVIDVLELDEQELETSVKRVQQGRRPFEPVPVLFELTEEQIARIAVNQYRLPGVEVEAKMVRHYPFGELFAHTVGYVGRINEDYLKKLDSVEYSGTHQPENLVSSGSMKNSSMTKSAMKWWRPTLVAVFCGCSIGLNRKAEKIFIWPWMSSCSKLRKKH